MKPIVITTCTNRKKQSPSDNLTAQSLQKGTLDQVASRWWRAVTVETRRYPAADLYAGRTFVEAKLAAAESGGQLLIISAGLGLIPCHDEVPAYDVTLSARAKGKIQEKIVEPIEPHEWWDALNAEKGDQHPIATVVRRHPKRMVLLALSNSYLEMISADLGSLAQNELKRVRLFGLRNLEEVPNALRDSVMPYSERFDGPDSPLPGTRGDFSQRTLRHFLASAPREIAITDTQAHRNFVERLMKRLREPPKLQRQQKSDEEIIDIVPELWERANGSSARMLRVLRDEEWIACEQGRFATLFKLAKERHCLA